MGLVYGNSTGTSVVYSYADHNNDTIIDERHSSFRKIYLSLYLKGLCVRGSWRPNKDCNILTPTLMAISVSFPFSWAVQPGVWGPSLSPIRLVSKLTDFLSSPSHIIVQRPPSCGRHKLHSFNPSTVKATLCYSSTGCTCYLHWHISYFDGSVGSLVNIQHKYVKCQSEVFRKI